MRYVMIVCLAALVGCGADGLPINPKLALGISIGPNGITPTVRASGRAGPVTVAVGN